MSTSLTSSALTIGSYSATAIAGSSSSASNYSTLATTAWVDAHDSVGSSPSLTNYISLSKIGRYKCYNNNQEVFVFDTSDKMFLGANSGRTNGRVVTIQAPTGSWWVYECWGISNFNAEGYNESKASWSCGAACLQIGIRAD